MHGWTHECLDLILEHAGGLPGELFVREVPGFAQPSVRHQMVHICSVESAWVCGLRGVPVMRLRAAEHPTVESVRAAKRQVAEATLAYLNGLSESELNTDLPRLPEGWMGPRRSPAFIVLHVLTHAFHHKGQLAAMFRMLGHPAPDTDLQR
jgi:uncharacterized damage-inducible protein DinB